MTLVERNQEVETFAANVPPKRSQNEFDVGALNGVRNTRTPMAVTSLSSSLEKMLFAVVNDELIRMTARERLAQLLRGPFRRRVRGHIVMQDSAGAQIHDDKYVQSSERGGDHNEEVAG